MQQEHNFSTGAPTITTSVSSVPGLLSGLSYAFAGALFIALIMFVIKGLWRPKTQVPLKTEALRYVLSCIVVVVFLLLTTFVVMETNYKWTAVIGVYLITVLPVTAYHLSIKKNMRSSFLNGFLKFPMEHVARCCASLIGALILVLILTFPILFIAKSLINLTEPIAFVLCGLQALIISYAIYYFYNKAQKSEHAAKLTLTKTLFISFLSSAIFSLPIGLEGYFKHKTDEDFQARYGYPHPDLQKNKIILGDQKAK